MPIAHCAVRADRRESTVIRKSSRAIFSSSLPLPSDSFVRAPFPLATLPFSRTRHRSPRLRLWEFRFPVEKKRSAETSSASYFRLLRVTRFRSIRTNVSASAPASASRVECEGTRLVSVCWCCLPIDQSRCLGSRDQLCDRSDGLIISSWSCSRRMPSLVASHFVGPPKDLGVGLQQSSGRHRGRKQGNRTIRAHTDRGTITNRRVTFLRI